MGGEYGRRVSGVAHLPGIGAPEARAGEQQAATVTVVPRTRRSRGFGPVKGPGDSATVQAPTHWHASCTPR